jgi:ApbE superfamily uncharacterized protein (UPF0280 family)
VKAAAATVVSLSLLAFAETDAAITEVAHSTDSGKAAIHPLRTCAGSRLIDLKRRIKAIVANLGDLVRHDQTIRVISGCLEVANKLPFKIEPASDVWPSTYRK